MRSKCQRLQRLWLLNDHDSHPLRDAFREDLEYIDSMAQSLALIRDRNG